MPRLRLVFFPALIALLAVAAGCGGGSTTTTTSASGETTSAPSTVAVPSGAVAIVAGTVIPQEQFDTLFDQAQAAYKAQQRDFPVTGTPEYESLKSEIVKFLVQREEFGKEAQALGITVTEDEVQQKLDELKQQFFEGDQARYEKELENLGLTEESLKDQLRASAISQKIYDEVTKDETVTPEEVQAYYDENKDQFTTPETRNVAHILVKTKAEAEAIEKQLQNGADFAKLAKEKSIDNQGGEGGSAANGGELGEAPRETYVKEFGDAAWALKTDEISAPVKSQFGWHVIKALGDITPAATTPFDEVKDSIEQQLLQTKRDAAMSKWVDDIQTKYAPLIGYALGFAPPAATTGGGTTGATTGG